MFFAEIKQNKVSNYYTCNRKLVLIMQKKCRETVEFIANQDLWLENSMRA